MLEGSNAAVSRCCKNGLQAHVTRTYLSKLLLTSNEVTGLVQLMTGLVQLMFRTAAMKDSTGGYQQTATVKLN
jgi:hypothetical protein